MKKYPSELAPKFMVRMSDELHSELKAAAARNRRSMNAEILIRLEGCASAVLPVISADIAANSERNEA